MRFHELPNRLRLYILAHPLVLAALTHEILLRPQPATNWRLVGTLLLFAVTFSTWKVELSIIQARMTPAVAFLCLTSLLQGLQPAILCAAIGSLVGTLARPANGGWRIRFFRPPMHRILFNVANCMVACILACLVYDRVVHLAPAGGLGTVLALPAFS